MSVDNIVRFVEECSNRPDFYLGFPHIFYYDYGLFLQFSKSRDDLCLVEYIGKNYHLDFVVKSYLYCSENKEDIESAIKALYKTLMVDVDRKNFWHYEKRDSHE